MRTWLTDLRTENGLTCKALGEKIGHTESYVFRVETAMLKKKGLDISLLIQIAKALGRDPVEVLQMEIDWLKGGKE